MSEDHEDIIKAAALNPPGGLRPGIGSTAFVRIEATVQVRRLDRSITEEDFLSDEKREEIFEAALAGVKSDCEVWPNGIPYRVISDHNTNDVVGWGLED